MTQKQNAAAQHDPAAPIKKASKRQPPIAAIEPAPLPPIWHAPDQFEFILDDGSLVIAEYDGANSIGFKWGDLHYDFHGRTISTTGYRSQFVPWAEAELHGNPLSTAIAVARSLAADTTLEIKQNKKTWPVKYTGDVAVKFDDGPLTRAIPITWQGFNRHWYMWLPDAKTSKMIRPEEIMGDWAATDSGDSVTSISSAVAAATPDVKTELPASPPAAPVKGLPDGIPEQIEIDIGGQKPRWVTATIIKVSGQRLTCRLDRDTLRETKVYARDIEWRVPVVA
jgi:hypothetical protein